MLTLLILPDKSFLTRKDAEDFVAGKNPPGPSDAKKVGEKFYGLAVGLKPGVYTDWTECQKQCTGVKGPKYRKFTTRKEAEEWVRDYSKNITKPKSTTAASGRSKRGRANDVEDSDGSPVEDSPVTKKVKSGSKSSSSAAASSASKSRVKIYTDGSSLGNGKVGASAGVGVFFGPNDPRYDHLHSAIHFLRSLTFPVLAMSPNPFKAFNKPTKEQNSWP